MHGKIPVSFACDRCGAEVEWPNHATDSTRVVCANCGTDGGTYRDLRDKAKKAARLHVEAVIRDALNDF